MSGEDVKDTKIPNLSGKYVLDRDENLDAFLAANGVPWLIRKMIASSRPNFDIVQDGNKMSLRLHSMVMDRTTTFTVGEDYDETQQDGAEMRVSSSWDGNKLVLNYKPKKEGVGKVQIHTRELKGNEMILTLQVGDITAKRIFKIAK